MNRLAVSYCAFPSALSAPESTRFEIAVSPAPSRSRDGLALDLGLAGREASSAACAAGGWRLPAAAGGVAHGRLGGSRASRARRRTRARPGLAPAASCGLRRGEPAAPPAAAARSTRRGGAGTSSGGALRLRPRLRRARTRRNAERERHGAPVPASSARHVPYYARCSIASVGAAVRPAAAAGGTSCPRPGVDCTSISPSCSCTVRYTIDRPMPLPSCLRREVEVEDPARGAPA